ncbi:ABC-type multidrug transport system ATPase component [Rubrobacter radiotolerans]|uniref:ABC-type multidrug transport system ATPase component n=1 Tax=Rubrobacter radiotolerans TaxID=42256 RepID=A0A023X1P3_RUBRA|nr:ATP-binding cassette domain-containing protein [Rubrobacter radiotolerans]AHY46392.1 ABC-type multidrug transport system ATPase component [Rubrobacter radiotolerans]MDX5893799.1 ATP-binding cassette domain-containing protein [Rubrobacter radiotolerans]SMC04521.1 lipooligosaccharide transport system ATP-binding protein [Rubrobacter radiotolerans DSM 5868]
MTATQRRTTDLATLAARDLRKSYDGFEAVRGVDFSVRRGECFGFLGPNGAGKSTTMKMIYGSAVPTSGELEVVGLDVKRSVREVKRRIGIVPQENNLDEELEVEENLLVYGRYFDLKSKVIRQRTESLLDFVQLREKSRAKVEELSGGMKRRLLIARALINDPELVVLDEPTTGLDPQARHLVWEKLRQLKSEGTTLILTTHYMDEAAQLCDRLVIMDGGRIIAEGDPLTLIRENTSPEVLELRPSPERLEELQFFLAAESDHVERSADLLLAYTSDSDALRARVRASGIPVENAFDRHAGLEDVFLRLTGRRLVE